MKLSTGMVVMAAAVALSPPAAAAAQPGAPGYPQKPVRVIVNVTAGGGVDNVARIAAHHYNEVWGQPFVVDNRAGANGLIGTDAAAKAPGDGYTMLLVASTAPLPAARA